MKRYSFNRFRDGVETGAKRKKTRESVVAVRWHNKINDKAVRIVESFGGTVARPISCRYFSSFVGNAILDGASSVFTVETEVGATENVTFVSLGFSGTRRYLRRRQRRRAARRTGKTERSAI